MAIPCEVLSDQLRGLINGRRVRCALFTTFTLEPHFFEREIVSLLAGDELVQDLKLRIVQLEEALRDDRIGPIAVYYDQRGLQDDGAKALDVSYVPLRVGSGVFHPKMVLVLTQPGDAFDDDETSLICGILSANVGESGWWRNVEAAHFEVLKAGEASSIKDDLVSALRHIRKLGGRDTDHLALDTIQEWLRDNTTGVGHATLNGRLRPRITAGTGDLVDFLLDTRGDELAGSSLEVISPFLDEGEPRALRELCDAFGLREVRVFLPVERDGTPCVTRNLYDAVRALPACTWARLPQAILKLGKDSNATTRGVHAKVYRFVKRSARYEALIIGSHNLTTAAHQKGGNSEASFMVEPESKGPIDFWLDVDEKRPRKFPDEVPSGSVGKTEYVPLQVAYHWDTSRVEARWDGGRESGELLILSGGSTVMVIGTLAPGKWSDVASPGDALREPLKNSAVVYAKTADGKTAPVLVQEYGMTQKPSYLLTLSTTEIFELWARLTPDQRAAYLVDKGSNIPEEMATRLSELAGGLPLESFFTSFAGVFHAFEMLRKQIEGNVGEKRPKLAETLLLGQRHDSLPRLIKKVIEEDQPEGLVYRYLVLLSARQLLLEFKSRDDEFFAGRTEAIDGLIAETRNADRLAASLSLGEDGDAFRAWFEQQFMKSYRAKGMVAAD
jgi:hypothetical protein